MLKKKKVFVVQIGARMHYAIPIIFSKRGLLEKFYTDFYLFKKQYKFLKIFQKKLPRFVIKMFGRHTDEILDNKIKDYKFFGILYTLKLRNSSKRAEQTKNYLWAGKTICHKVLNDDLKKYDIFYGFNTDSLEILEKCKEIGIFSIVEQTIASKRLHNNLLIEEAKKWPLLEPNFSDKYVEEIIKREKQEWDMASIIVCASDFVKRSIINEGVDKNKIHVIPYAVKTPLEYKKIKTDEFHVIFVGNLGLRKGGIYFLETAKKMASENIKFTVIGSISMNQNILEEYRPYVNFTGSIPRDQVRNYYLKADVMCLPSLCEGSATVSYEALSYGIPLITTYNSGTVVEDGKEGFIVPIRDVDAIICKLQLLIDNPNILKTMSINAKRKSYDYTWERYEERLINLIEKVTK
jgi:glycosyltransferase involved in cell wall biosynthesis